ncbi:hypothetical protein [Sinomonas terrae]|jgi:hypothetical protein|uniref:Ribbon-helix-helix protein CopG domain-containing protein n=1 Tax=Sinomonas terrae TaxID=2908838 RepID=A0ABS9U7G8_9MICC|nr:hypothetical protein [Sinomonas terrae]MCH6472457.1 hypothetical protein [Sinomonas terrae]
MARPYKGDRHVVTAKIPRADADKLQKVVELTAETRSDIVARLLHEHLKSIDIDALERHQEALPIARAS